MKPVVYQNLSALPMESPGFMKVGTQTVRARFGVIGHIASAGYGILLDSAKQEYSFSFGAIEHYHGQSASTLASFGLKEGEQVRFALVDGRIALVQPYIRPSSPSLATADPRP